MRSLRRADRGQGRPHRRGREAISWLFASLGLLGCTRPAEPIDPVRIADALRDGQALVVMRFVQEDMARGVRVDEPGSAVQPEFWNPETLERLSFTGAPPSAAAATAGWVVQPLPAGTYVLRLRARAAAGEVVSEHYALSVDAGGVVHAGTFPFRCDPGPMPRTRCRPAGPPAISGEDGATLVPGLPEPGRIRLATPFEAPAPPQGWPLPARIGVDVDARAWRAAVDWGGFVDREQSRAAFGTAAGLMDIAAPIGSSSELGAIVATPIALAALGAAMVGAAHAANEAGQQARYERRFASCVERLGAQFAPDVVRPAVEAALATAPEAGAPARAVRSGMSTAPWQVSLTRVVFRRCGDSKRYGVEVASRWRAPGVRADLLSRPRGALPDPALAWSEPAPWEIVIDGDAPCRSFEAYCEAGSEGLVTRDIVTAVQAARDAILAAPAADRGGRSPPRAR